jgi:hypothetical protein
VRRLDHTIGPAKIVIENNDRFINQLFWRTTSYHRKFLFLLLERDLTNSKYGRATAAFVGSDLDQACCQFAHPAQPPQICQAVNKEVMPLT